MAASTSVAGWEISRRVFRVQFLTIAWMTLEAALSLYASWRSHSPALLAFGGDSAIEWLSAVIVLGAFRERGWRIPEKTANRTVAVLLFALAGYSVLVAGMTLLGRNRTKPSYLGVATLIAAAVIMPLLAREKRRLSALSGSAALRGDSAQSALCGYLSLIALGGVALNAFLHVGWADPMAALAITPLVLREGREVLRGKACGCC